MICKQGYPALLPPAAYSNVSIIGTLHMYDKRVQKTWVRRPCIVLASFRALRAAGLPPARRRPAVGAISALPELAGSEATVTTSGSSLPRPWGYPGKSLEYRNLECHSPLCAPCRYPVLWYSVVWTYFPAIRFL